MKSWAIAGIVAALSIVSAAHAKGVGDAAGPGLELCSTFTDGYKKDRQATEAFFFSWAEGFMTGVNFGKPPTEKAALGSMPVEQQLAHIRSFCDTNPNVHYFAAVADLYSKLSDETPKPGERK